MPINLEISRYADSSLVIRNADHIAVEFFERDLSSVDPHKPISYDDRALNPWNPIQFNECDAAVIKRGMRLTWAPDELWTWLVENAPVAVLEPLQVEWDLVAMDDELWTEARARLADALAAFIQEESGDYRALATVTKILHLKRPALIPILDRNVRAMLGVRLGDSAVHASQVRQGLLGCDLIRRAGRDNRDALLAIQGRLRERNKERSLSRILDAVLWKIY